MSVPRVSSIPNITRNFDGLRGDQLCTSELSVEVHPAQPIVLIAVQGTAITLGLDDEGVRVLIDQLIRCHNRLLERAAVNGNSRP